MVDTFNHSTETFNFTKISSTTVQTCVNIQICVSEETDEHTNDTRANTTTNDLLENISNGLWIYLSPFIFALGMIGNSLNLIVLRRMKSWNRTTILFMTFLSITDMTVLCSGPTRYWIRAVTDLDIRTLSDFGCKVNLFIVYTSMQFSSWIRVSLTFERFLMTSSPLTYSIKLTRTKAIIALLLTLVILMAINCHFFWTNGLIKDNTACGSLTPEYLYFDEFAFVFIDLIVLSILPFVFMLILSTMTIRLIHKAEGRRKSFSSSRARVRSTMGRHNNTGSPSGTPLTRMLVFSSFYFLLATVPISIYFIVDSYFKPTADPVIEMKLDLAWSICYIFQYSIYGINFYVYISSNVHYRYNVKTIIVRKNRRQTEYRIQTVFPLINLAQTQRTSREASGMVGVSNNGFVHKEDNIEDEIHEHNQPIENEIFV